jgi:hypothetical protein
MHNAEQTKIWLPVTAAAIPSPILAIRRKPRSRSVSLATLLLHAFRLPRPPLLAFAPPREPPLQVSSSPTLPLFPNLPFVSLVFFMEILSHWPKKFHCNRFCHYVYSRPVSQGKKKGHCHLAAILRLVPCDQAPALATHRPYASVWMSAAQDRPSLATHSLWESARVTDGNVNMFY